MHNCSKERLKARSPKSAIGLVPSTTVFQSALVLLVEPHGNMQSPKVLLATDKRYCVIDVNHIREMMDLRDEDISAVVLSVALGWRVVREAAISVRRQWPAAGILLQGRVRPDFEDHLYELAADSAIDPAAFMHALNAICSSHKALPKTDIEEVRPSTPESLRAPQSRPKGGLSEAMSLIRSPQQGAWSKLVGTPKML